MIKYILLGIIILIALIIIVLYFIMNPIKLKKNWEERLTEFLKENDFSFELSKIEKDLPFQYQLEINNKKYYIAFLIVPSYSEIQINNINTWEIKYGAGNAVGKIQPHKKMAKNITPFMNYQCQENEIKVMVITPDAKKITKYINESEIVFVNPKTDVYGAKIINESDYSLFIGEKNEK